MRLTNGIVFTDHKFQKIEIRTKDYLIVEMGESLSFDSSEETFDLQGKLLLPGLVDIHTHGCAGYDFSFADAAGIQTMCREYLKRGVTSVMATTMTNEYESIKQAMRVIGEEIKEQEKVNQVMCKIRGINMEGPFLGEDKKGAHDPRYLLPISESVFEELDALSGGQIRLIDIDPKLSGALPFIQKYSKSKTISLAHTSCDYELAKEAAAAGATHITHLFNAMNGLHHRKPGLVGALVDFLMRGEIICDGIHVAAPVIRLMFLAVPDKMILISDSMSAAGLQDGLYELGGQRVTVEEGKAALEDGTIAGSTTNMLAALQTAISFGVKREDAITSATLIPAEAVGISNVCGSIEVGKIADMLICTDQLCLEKVVLNGKIIKI